MINVGVIGYGLSARTFHIPLIESLPDLYSLKYIVWRSSREDTVVIDNKHVKILKTTSDLFASVDVDLVVITTSNDSHASLCREAIKAGKHVIIEKPFTSTLEEAEQLHKEAEESGLIVSVYQNRRWDSDFLSLKKILHSNTLGNIVHVTSRFDRYRPTGKGGWRDADVVGGGLLLDLGSHLVDQAVSLFGVPSTIQAIVKNQRGLPTNDYFFITLDYTQKGGPIVQLTASVFVRGENPVRFVVSGTHGTWTKNGLDVQEGQLKAGLTPLKNAEKFGEEDKSNWGTIDSDVNGVHIVGRVESEKGTYLSYYKNVAEAITTKQKSHVAVTTGQAVLVMKLLSLAKESSERNVTINIT